MNKIALPSCIREIAFIVNIYLRMLPKRFRLHETTIFKFRGELQMWKTLRGFTIIVLVISIGLIFNYVSQNGQFTKWCHTSLDRELFEDGKAYYIDYPFKWEGIGNPTLEKIELIKNDGIKIEKNDEHFRIKTFITNEQRGSFDEESAIKEGVTVDLIPVKGYKVKNDFNLAIIAELTDHETDQDINTVRITYKKLGIVHSQTFPLMEESFMRNKGFLTWIGKSLQPKLIRL